MKPELAPTPAPTAPARRDFIRTVVAAAVGTTPLLSAAASATTVKEDISFAGGPRQLVAYPQKRPLIRVTTRPPHLETPFAVFNHGPITPNDAFYVRYHLANLPLSIDADTYRLEIKGKVKQRLNLSLAELKTLGEPVEVVAVNQCSGNSRGYQSPRVTGAQLGNGAMGNARWVGVPLKTVLEKAGLDAGAKQVVFNGLDAPVLPATSDFRKALDLDVALMPVVMLAWSMNGEDLPFLNGYPLKLIVPGYFGTYWVKHLSDIEVIDTDFSGHDAVFMNTAYRLPDNDCLCVAPGAAAGATKPIARLPVRSFITNVASGAVLPAARTVELKGMAFDDGSGLNAVDVSIDGGRTWRAAQLGQDLGRFSFREWTLPVHFGGRPGRAVLMVRAGNRRGEVQPMQADWNPGGYRRHVVESYHVTVA
jgi:DMSO/TMAO reductase YedYZ molybdopterin-dependent catalytic subunit